MVDQSEPSFTVRTQGTYLHTGAKIDVQYPDGKGVSGLLAGVDIAAGGSPFQLIVTHDGAWPEDRPETASDEATGEAPGARAQSEFEELTATLRTTERRLRESRTQADNLRRQRDASAEEVVKLYRWLGEKNQELGQLNRQLAMMRQEVEEQRARASRLQNFNSQQQARLAQQAEALREANERLRGQMRDLPGVLIVDPEPRERPSHRVMTWHEPDGSITIRVEDMR
jgi:hypothetical protein